MGADTREGGFKPMMTELELHDVTRKLGLMFWVADPMNWMVRQEGSQPIVLASYNNFSGMYDYGLQGRLVDFLMLRGYAVTLSWPGEFAKCFLHPCTDKPGVTRETECRSTIGALVIAVFLVMQDEHDGITEAP